MKYFSPPLLGCFVKLMFSPLFSDKSKMDAAYIQHRILPTMEEQFIKYLDKDCDPIHVETFKKLFQSDEVINDWKKHLETLSDDKRDTLVKEIEKKFSPMFLNDRNFGIPNHPSDWKDRYICLIIHLMTKENLSTDDHYDGFTGGSILPDWWESLLEEKLAPSIRVIIDNLERPADECFEWMKFKTKIEEYTYMIQIIDSHVRKEEEFLKRWAEEKKRMREEKKRKKEEEKKTKEENQRKKMKTEEKDIKEEEK